MRLRNMQSNFLYEEDSTLGTPTPLPETEQGNKTGDTNGEKKKPEPITLTTGQLKKRLEDAKAADRKAFLESLGLSDEASLKSLVDSHKAKTEADKTESQKLNERLATLEKQLQEKEAKIAESERSRRLDKRDSELKALLSKAYEPSEVLLLLKASHGDKLDALLDEDGNFDSAAATALITEYQTAKPHLFKDTSLGSAFSHKDGKAPQPNEEARKALATMTAKSLKGF